MLFARHCEEQSDEAILFLHGVNECNCRTASLRSR
jgi:hypothetical protein